VLSGFYQQFKSTFLYKSVLHSLNLLTVWPYNFVAKNIGKKVARKMLVKLTPVAFSTTELKKKKSPIVNYKIGNKENNYFMHVMYHVFY